MYQTYIVLRRAGGSKVGSVSATCADEAVYRLMGGEYGRTDYVALVNTDGPMAVEGCTSYRYRGRYGPVMIGARNHAEALREASRSITGDPDASKLEVWSPDALSYVAAL